MLWGKALWSASYVAGSCGGAPIAVIRQYIEQQCAPHRASQRTSSASVLSFPGGRGLSRVWVNQISSTVRKRGGKNFFLRMTIDLESQASWSNRFAYLRSRRKGEALAKRSRVKRISGNCGRTAVVSLPPAMPCR